MERIEHCPYVNHLVDAFEPPRHLRNTEGPALVYELVQNSWDLEASCTYKIIVKVLRLCICEA